MKRLLVAVALIILATGQGLAYSTSTLQPGSGERCSMIVGLDDAVSVAGLGVEVAYAPTGADLLGQGESANCRTLAVGSLAAFNDQEALGVLAAGFLHPAGVQGPVALFECALEVAVAPAPEDFLVVVSEALDEIITVIDPLPSVSVWSVDCPGGDGDSLPVETTSTSSTTSSTSTTSTTFSASTTTTVPSNTGDCIAESYELLVGVDGEGSYAALQLSVDYSGAAGELPGEADQVLCEATTYGSFSSFNNVVSDRQLNAAFISMGGFPADEAVMSCLFTPWAASVLPGVAPSAADFNVGVVDATTLEMSAALPLPAGKIYGVLPLSGCQVCGNGIVEDGEQCDDGNNDDSDSCVAGCVSASCGDTYLHLGVESCDDGDLNSDQGAGACRSDCSLPRCGDQVVDPGEQCDDADSDNGDYCLEGCVLASCGDGYLHREVEQCDLGAGGNNDHEEQGCFGDCSSKDICGDASGDGEVSATDARRILRTAVGLASSCDHGRCDVDGSGRVTAQDARRVLRTAVGFDDEYDCMLGVSLLLEGNGDYGALQLAVDYSGAGGGFLGAGDEVHCEVVAESVDLAVFNNVLPLRELALGMISIDGVSGPVELVRCRFLRRHDVEAEQAFMVDVVAWEAAGTAGVEAPVVSLRFTGR